MPTPLITRILFATDFSDDAARAQEYAMYLATAWDAKVDVLHVIEAPAWLNADAATVAVVEQVRIAAARRLEQVRDHMVRSGISAKVRQVLGNPHEHICLATKDNGVDLVVLGVQGRTNLLYGLIGSTAERVVKDGPCPVLTVPGLLEEVGKPSMASRQVPVRHILAPLDFSSSSLDAVECAVPRRHCDIDACVGASLLRLGLRPWHDRRGSWKARPLDQGADGTDAARHLIRTAGGFRDFWGDSLRCDPGLRLAASIRSHCDGDTWASRSNRRTLWKRGGGSAAPDDLPDLDRKDAEVRRGSPSCDAAGDGREAVRIVTSRFNEFDFAHIVDPVSIPDDVRDHEVLCPLEATGCDDVLD